MTDESCNTCAAFSLIHTNRMGVPGSCSGECRRRAPSPRLPVQYMANDDTPTGISEALCSEFATALWPLVDGDDWCCEWKEIAK